MPHHLQQQLARLPRVRRGRAVPTRRAPQAPAGGKPAAAARGRGTYAKRSAGAAAARPVPLGLPAGRPARPAHPLRAAVEVAASA